MAAAVGLLGGWLVFRNSARQARNCSLSLSTGAFKSGAKRSLAGDMTSPALCSKCGSVTRSMPIWMGEASSPSISFSVRTCTVKKKTAHTFFIF